MSKLGDDILRVLKDRPGLSDRELTDTISGQGKQPQPVNGECRRLCRNGIIERRKRNDGITGNYLTGAERVSARRKIELHTRLEGHTEDHVKHCVAKWLAMDGWEADIRWGRDRGIDIHARRSAERWVIEVKGIGAYPQMRVNFFLSALAETLQRMDDPHARYSIAVPDTPQYRGLWMRLPQLAKQRTCISALFVSKDGKIDPVK